MIINIKQHFLFAGTPPAAHRRLQAATSFVLAVCFFCTVIGWGFIRGRACSALQLRAWASLWAAAFLVFDLWLRGDAPLSPAAWLSETVGCIVTGLWLHCLLQAESSLWLLTVLAALSAVPAAKLLARLFAGEALFAHADAPPRAVPPEAKKLAAHCTLQLITCVFAVCLALSATAHTPSANALLRTEGDLPHALESSVWETLDVTRRTAALQAVVDRETTRYRIPSVEIRIAPLADGIMGSYSVATGQITLSASYLESGTAREMVVTAVHETRHYYQYYTVRQCEAAGLFRPGSFAGGALWLETLQSWYDCYHLPAAGVPQVVDSAALEADAYAWETRCAALYLPQGTFPAGSFGSHAAIETVQEDTSSHPE